MEEPIQLHNRFLKEGNHIESKSHFFFKTRQFKKA